MTTYAKQQAAQLLETGQCHFPLTWDDIANRVASSPSFAHALYRLNKGQPRLLEMLVLTAANQLCKEQDNAS